VIKHKINSTALALLSTFSVGVLLLAGPNAHAVDPGPPGVGLCFGFGFGLGTFGGIVDADNSGGLELLVPSSNDSLKLDGDVDNLAEALLTRSVRLVDSVGQDVWSTPAKLVLGTDDVNFATADDVVPFVFMNLGSTRITGLFPFPFICEGYGVVESGGQRYVLAALGISAAEGDETSGTDYSVVKVHVLNASSGAILTTHKFSAQSSNYLLLDESGVGDFDGDGDDELFIVRVVPLGTTGDKQKFKIVVETYNLLTKAQEVRFVIFKNDVFSNANPIP